MKVLSTLVTSVVTVLGAGATPVLSQKTSENGQATVGAHEVGLKAGSLYEIRIEGKDFQPRVMMSANAWGFLAEDYNPNVFLKYYLPDKDETRTVFVAPELLNLTSKGPFNYKFEVTRMALAARAVLDVKAKLTANDPLFSKAHHKAYDIKFDAKQFYVIDMHMTPSAGASRSPDVHLYLLDSNGKLIRETGESYDARILFPPRAGAYRIIVAGREETALGEFTLTVRTTEKQ